MLVGGKGRAIPSEPRMLVFGGFGRDIGNGMVDKQSHSH